MSEQLDARIPCVVCVEPGKTDKNVLQRLSLSGTIRSVYSWELNQGLTNFFVEFDDPASANSALRCEVPATKLYMLSDRRDLISRFTSIACQASPSHDVKSEHYDNNIPTLSSENRPRKRLNPVARAYSGRKRTRDDRANSQKNSQGKKRRDVSPYSSPSGTYTRSPRKKRSLPGYMRDTEKENGQGMVPALIPSSSGTSVTESIVFTESDALQNFANPLLDFDPFIVNPGGDAFNLSNPAFASDSSACFPQFHSFPFSIPQPESIPFSLPSLPFPSFASLPTPSPSTPATALSPATLIAPDGSAFTCALDSLPEDPRGMIDILKQSAASPTERDKWMIIAGHYRGQGNVEAALAVVTAMVEVMTSPIVGLPENELKPAYLMLSSCHTDLAKRARSSGMGGQVREDHHRKAQEYLQKVYGKNTPADAPPSLAAPQPSRVVNALNLHTSPVASENTGSVSVTTGISGKGPNALERELQSLRDRHQYLNKQYTEVKTAKRKAEDDLDKEYRLRRKVERELSALKQELESAQRSERFSLEQSRREVELRRKAEQRTEDLKDELAKVKDRLEVAEKGTTDKDKRAKECFGRIGMMFLKASKGDMSGLEGSVISHTSSRRSSSRGLEGFKREQRSVDV